MQAMLSAAPSADSSTCSPLTSSSSGGLIHAGELLLKPARSPRRDRLRDSLPQRQDRDRRARHRRGADRRSRVGGAQFWRRSAAATLILAPMEEVPQAPGAAWRDVAGRMTSAIVTRGLTKDYGSGHGLFDLDLEVGGGRGVRISRTPTGPARPRRSGCSWG